MLGDGRYYYFRPRPGGAALMKISYDPRLRRSRMTRIAGVETATGAISTSDGHTLTDAERWLITDYLTRGNGLTGRSAQAVEQIGHIAHWAQFRATPEELGKATEELLLAMQDLRDVLNRKAAQRVTDQT
ncbi:MAG: hypothetical protein ACK4HW_09050 [Roseinatronobacter sp.]